MSRTVKIVVGVVLVLVVAAGAGIWWYLRDDSPAAVDLDTASESVTTTTGGAGTSTPGGGIDGTWVVDTESGEFDFQSATGTFVGFRVEEELTAIGSTTAVGRTGDVSGSMTIADGTLTEADVEVQMATITTDRSQRDSRVRSALDTDSIPTAGFVLTEPVDLGSDPAASDVSVTATGELTLHGVTRTVEVPLEARLVDGTVVVVGSFEVQFSDYDVEAPSAPVVLSVSDSGTIEMQLLLTRQG
jgi:polyisoprenoid-binding protein YceI